MKNVIIRTITGIAFIIIVTLSVVYSSETFFALFLLLEILSLLEFYNITNKQSKPQKTLGSLTGAYIFIASFFWHYLKSGAGIYLSLLFFVLITFIFIAELYRNNKQPLINIAVTILGLVYISIPFGLLSHIAYTYNYYDGSIILGIFILIWTYDTGAYVFGMLLGKHRLFERVSPKKSWEGFFGGMLSVALAIFILTKYFNQSYSTHWYVVGAIIVIFGTLGDLTESLLKRNLKIKDSGKILPGHGGILDRFDGLLLSIPVIFTYFYFFLQLN